MREKLRQILKSKKGVTSVQTAVIFIIIMAVFALVIEYTSTVAIGRQIEQTAQNVLDSLLMKNAMDLFESVKNGRTSIEAWQDKSKFTFLDENGNTFRDLLTQALGVNSENSGGKQYYRGAADKKIFFIADADIVPQTITEDLLVVTTTIKVGREIGIWNLRVPVTMSLHLESRYTKMSAISAGQTTPQTQSTTYGDLLNRDDAKQATVKDRGNTPREDRVTQPSAGDIIIS